MSNHLHLVVNSEQPHQLNDVIRDFKKFAAKKIIGQILNEPESRREWMLNEFSNATTRKHKTYKFWIAGNHALELYNEKFAWTKICYIHNNPVVEGLVKEPQDWVYSSASNYCDEESILKEVYCVVPTLTRF